MDLRHSGFPRECGTDDTLQASRIKGGEVTLSTADKRGKIKFYDLNNKFSGQIQRLEAEINEISSEMRTYEKIVQAKVYTNNYHEF